MADALQGTWVFNESLQFTLSSNTAVSMDYSVDGVTYVAMTISGASAPNKLLIYGSTTVYQLGRWRGEGNRYVSISSTLDDINIPFSSTTVEEFLTWLQSNATKLPDTPTYTYTVKSYDGASDLASVSAYPITAAQFTDGTLTLTDADGSTHIASWTSAVPEGMKLLGLAYTQGATSADIPIGEAVSVLWEADTVLYEIYAPIVATLTYNGSVIAELNGGQAKRLKVKDTYMDDDILVEAAEQVITLQEKTVTPTKSVQEVTADEGNDGLSKVTVEAIPSEYVVPSGTLSITENRTYDVTNYASVDVAVADSPLPIEVSTEAEMTALLTSGEVGGVYKYTGTTTESYENGALYALEASE